MSTVSGAIPQAGGGLDFLAKERTVAGPNFNRWLVSNSFAYRRLTSNVGGHSSSSQDLEGAFEVNGAVADWGVRAGIDYVLRPGAKFRTFNLSLDHDLGHQTMLRIVASRQLSGGSATRAGVSISRRVGI